MTRSTHSYGSHPSQVGELFLPGGSGPFAVAVVVHGGYWRAQYDRSLMTDLCVDLAAHGLAAWNLEYRRVGAGGGWPETFVDVAAGIDAARRARRAARSRARRRGRPLGGRPARALGCGAAHAAATGAGSGPTRPDRGRRLAGGRPRPSHSPRGSCRPSTPTRALLGDPGEALRALRPRVAARAPPARHPAARPPRRPRRHRLDADRGELRRGRARGRRSLRATRALPRRPLRAHRRARRGMARRAGVARCAQPSAPRS